MPFEEGGFGDWDFFEEAAADAGLFDFAVVTIVGR